MNVIRRRTKLQKRRGYIRGGIPALPIFGLILILSSFAGFTFLRSVLLGGGTKALVLSLSEKIVTAMDGEGEVVIPNNTYVFVKSCPDILLEKDLEMWGEKLKENEIKTIKDRCSVNGGVACVGKKIGKNMIKYCSYSIKEPKEPLEMLTKRETLLKFKKENEIEVTIEVK